MIIKQNEPNVHNCNYGENFQCFQFWAHECRERCHKGRTNSIRFNHCQSMTFRGLSLTFCCSVRLVLFVEKWVSFLCCVLFYFYFLSFFFFSVFSSPKEGRTSKEEDLNRKELRWITYDFSMNESNWIWG